MEPVWKNRSIKDPYCMVMVVLVEGAEDWKEYHVIFYLLFAWYIYVISSK